MSDLPKQIGRYEVVHVIGRGGMGVVYKARDPNIGRDVAIKMIKPSLAQDEETADVMRERFKREAQSAGILQHPGIVTVYDADEDNGSPYMVMEFVEGRALEDILEENPHALVDRAASIVAQTARALAFAHEKGIIHRDVKPANILLTACDEAKVMDFGIAKVEGSSMTKPGTVLGSSSYMSPEQVTGTVIDHRSDIFSLGVVLYELLTGERPFLGENYTSISYRVVRVEAVPPAEINPRLDPAFNAIIQKAMAKRPEERYQSGNDFAADLEAVMAGKPVTAPQCLRPDSSTAVALPSADDNTGEVKISPDADTEPDIPAMEIPLPRKSRLKWIALAVVVAIAAALSIYFILHARDPYARAQDLILAGKHEDAVKLLRKIVADSPEDPLAHFLLAKELAATGDFNGAIGQYSEASQLNEQYKNSPEMITSLLAAPKGPDADMAVLFIVSQQGPATKNLLQESLKNPSYNVHWNACAALGSMKQKCDELQLHKLDLAKNPDCAVRKTAAEKIGELGSRADIPALEAAKAEKRNQATCMGDSIDKAIKELKSPKKLIPAPQPDKKDSSDGGSWKKKIDKIFGR